MTTQTQADVFTDLLTLLHRGGKYGCYFVMPGKRHVWWQAGQAPAPPTGKADVWFGVHPMASKRRKNENVAAINCVYADADAPLSDRVKDVPPSVIIETSPGKHHDYWLLDDPLVIQTDQDRQRARDLQARWVAFVGSDDGAKDLARVLRVPGTHNHKRDTPHLVRVVSAELDRRYSLEALEALLPAPEPEPTRARATHTATVDPLQRGRYWQKALENAAEMIRRAPDGDKHTELLKAARLLGGYVAGGIGTEAEARDLLETEIRRKPNVVSVSQADATIADGIEYGRGAPITYGDLEAERQDWRKRHGYSASDNGNPTTPPEPPEPPDGDQDQDQKQKQRGAPRKYKLLTRDYMSLYREWEYDARLNLANYDIEVNGQVVEDHVKDEIQSRVRDYGTQHNATVNVAHALESLSVMAMRNAYHPIRDYLEGLRYDGQDPIGQLASYFETENGMFGRWLLHWLAGAVAKVYEQYPNEMLVLDGAQDIGKSYFARWICPLRNWFQEGAIYPDQKDCKLQLIRSWIWEVSELGTTTRKADVEGLKAFITLRDVRERKPYDRYDTRRPSLASFIGTVNNAGGFLVDQTGNRRFLVCTVNGINWAYSQKVNVNAVWAQAYHVYKSGADWQLTAEDKQRRDAQNEGYMVEDPIQEYIESLYTITGDSRHTVDTQTILNDLSMYGIRPTRGNAMALAAVLKKLGAEKDKVYNRQGKRVNGYKGLVRDVRATDDDENEIDGNEIPL